MFAVGVKAEEDKKHADQAAKPLKAQKLEPEAVSECGKQKKLKTTGLVMASIKGVGSLVFLTPLHSQVTDHPSSAKSFGRDVSQHI